MSSSTSNFDPMAPVEAKPTERTRSGRRDAFNIVSGFVAGLIARAVTGNDYVGLATASTVPYLVAKTSLFEAGAKFVDRMGKASSGPTDLGTPKNEGPA